MTISSGVTGRPSSGSIRLAISRTSGRYPSVAPYWSASCPLLRRMSPHAANSSTGKIAGSGRPPANEIMPGRWISLNSSRMGEGRILIACSE